MTAAGARGDTATDQARQVSGTSRQQGGAVVGHATDAATDVVDTARQQLGVVAEHAAGETERLVGHAQHQLTNEADRHTTSAGRSLGELADELHSAADAARPGGAVQALLERIAAEGEQLANRLQHQSPEELMRDVERLGRRRTGAFTLAALAAGFTAARLAKHADDGNRASPRPTR